MHRVLIPVFPHVLHDIEEQGEGVLGNRFRGVTCGIAPADSALFKIIQIKIIGAGGSFTDKLKVFCLSHTILVDHHFVCQDHIGVPGS